MLNNQNLDKSAPQSLCQLQQWFAQIITAPLSEGEKINALSPSGNPIKQEAELFIQQTDSLQPYERLEIYNQNYWWRLLGHIQKAFPFVVRLFGYDDFNTRLAIPYLQKHPPKSWDLARLGEHFVSFIEQNYNDKDSSFVIEAVKLDWAFEKAFHTPQAKANIYNESLLQPHIQLLSLTYNLPPLRMAMLQQPVNYWITHDFPKIEKEGGRYYFKVYRNKNFFVRCTKLCFCQFLILSELIDGKSIEESMEVIEKQEDAIIIQAETSLASWFYEWKEKGLFVINSIL